MADAPDSLIIFERGQPSEFSSDFTAFEIRIRDRLGKFFFHVLLNEFHPEFLGLNDFLCCNDSRYRFSDVFPFE